MQCEMCGSEKDLVRAKIEGTELKVCRKCSEFGKVLGPVIKEVEEKKPENIEEEEPEVVEMVVSNFSEIIRNKREKLRLNQKDFARKLNEKESIIHKIENSSFKPSLSMARKLESLLNIKLIEEYAETKIKGDKKIEGKSLTIGDLIKIKRR